MKIKTIVSALAVSAAVSAIATTIDFSQTAGPVKPVNGIGQPPMIGALGDWGMMHYLKEAGIPYSRLHDVGGWLGGGLYVDIPNLFPDFDVDENDPKNYRFAYTDNLIKALVDQGVEPFFRLGVTIENWAERGLPPLRCRPPRDFAKWARICEHVIRHYTEGWADGFRYKITYWEIWNEPDNSDVLGRNPMWQAPFADYIRFYGVVAPHLKAKFPQLKIGGYGSCGFYAGTGADHIAAANSSPRLSHFIDCAHAFLKAARDNQWPLDFFSYHSYSDAPEALRQVAFADSLLTSYGFTADKTERIFNEWLPVVSHENLGTAKQSVQIAAELIGLQNGPCDVACIYDGRCGPGDYSPLFNPMTYKPHKAYYVYRMFNELRKLGSSVKVPATPQGIYVTAATDGTNADVMVANISRKPWQADFDFGDWRVIDGCVIDEERTFAFVPAPKEIAPNATWLIRLRKDGTGEKPDYDVVIYGSSPAAISAAVQAKRMGKTCVVVSPETRIGGLTTGGLGQTDIGNKRAFGGIALEFYRDVAKYYWDEANWTRQKRSDYLPDGQCSGTKGTESMWTFEPSAALKILGGWEKGNALDIRRGEFLDRESKCGVEVEGRRIKSIRTLSGRTYRGKMFVDATYEGDLMAAVGVSYAVGREANGTYGETLNGTQVAEAKSHQFVHGVDPYVVAGDPSSGLLPNVEPGPVETDGTGDRRVQAYCFRMCLTDDPENRIPFAKPADYDEREYELLFRHLAALEKKVSGGKMPLPWINSKMPNRKTDTNNRDACSTDFIGRNWAWPEASYAEREKIRAEHLRYQRGLMWTLANHPRVPRAIRDEVSRWGTCRDEFADGLGDGWQAQLYVREARRMVGDYVMSEENCTGRRIAPRPVAMAAYTMDSHNVRRIVGKDGFVHNEGDVEVGGGKPYPIDYGALIPKAGECANLFVPVCLSASHIAFGSIRMEPVFFALGQAAATAAALAIDAGCAVQDLAYGPLADRLRADGQVLALDAIPAGKTVSYAK